MCPTRCLVHREHLKNMNCCSDRGLVDNPSGGLSGNWEVTWRVERRRGVGAPGAGGSPSLEGSKESLRFTF